jgi:DNA-directed RNA polymerase specialized sigma24 family protein
VSTYRGRAHRRHEQLIDPADMPDTAVRGPLAMIIACDELKILGEVTPARRKVLVAFGQGYGIPEIAEVLAIPVATAWGRLRQGRLDLLAILRRNAARGR